jgi:2-polyprenyl-3-methyl-5-hydroxy-6-metoxy-1,4-benzoquinol methylase
MFLHPMPTGEEMQAYAERHYRDGVYAEYARARELKLETFRRRLALLQPHRPGKRLLDLGSACGFLLEAALAAGFDPTGVEFSAEAIQLARPEVRDRIHRGDVSALPPGQGYDVLTAFDIIEHAHDPVATLRSWAGLLGPGGLLVLTSPDTDSAFRKVLGARWPMLQPFQHTAMFSAGSVGRFLEQAGFSPLEVRPAEKVMTPAYLLGQLELYFPRLARWSLRAGRPFPGLLGRPIPFRIGEFLAIARKR